MNSLSKSLVLAIGMAALAGQASAADLVAGCYTGVDPSKVAQADDL